MKCTVNRVLFYFVWVNVFALAEAGCKKDQQKTVQDPPPGPGPDPISVTKDLQVAFGAESIDITKTDSVVLRLVAEDKTVIRKKCVKKDKTFQSGLNDIKAGTWLITAEVFTNEKESGNRFTLSKTVQLPLTEKFEIKAPTNKLTDQWAIWFLEDLGDVKLYVPADPADPLFEMEVEKPGWDFVYLQKVLQVNNRPVDGADWKCEDNCFSGILNMKNNTHFFEFSQRAKSTAWNSYEVILQMIHIKEHLDLTMYRRYTR